MITITLTIALELTCFIRAELGCYSQSYSDPVDIRVLTELNTGAIVRVIVILLIYVF
jgi:hypothetical protein